MTNDQTPRSSWRPSKCKFVLPGFAGIVLVYFLGPAAVHAAPPEAKKAESPFIFDKTAAATRESKEAATLNEITRMDSAFKAYKERYGSYPPSDFTKLDDAGSPQHKALLLHIAHSFPHCNPEAELAAVEKLGVKSPAQALCFWLHGFSSDPEHPISRLLDDPKGNYPFVAFDEKRLKYPAGEKSCPVYVPENGGDAPYVYFSSVSYATQAPFNADFKQGGKGIAKPYQLDKSDKGEFVNAKSFQIISAGADGDYGGGKSSFPSGAGYEAGDKDNLTNFATSSLGDAISK